MKKHLPRIVFGIVGVWGLASGLMLVHTLLATKQLDRRVTAITATVSEIDRDTASIGLMEDTNRLSGDLLAASRPLPGTLGSLRDTTTGLAGKLDSILAGTTTIERDSGAVEREVTAARGTAAEINGSVRTIGQSLASILATLRATQQAAGEINGSVRGINAAVAALLPVTADIDAGIGMSNRGIVVAAGLADGIRADIGDILALTPDLVRHADSIDCSSGLNLLGLLTGPGACAR